ncbi:helix-turn-helix transcriptional regulator [Streptomyces bullii]|uniref:Response regulator transcription factor n=1 Tax=Streptomyces bullii TaxID=349910 RepID=A0ABW0UTS7_9ACTN
MASEALSPRLLAQLRAATERSPGAPAARTVRLLLDEIDRLNGEVDQLRSSPALAQWEPDAECPLSQRHLQVIIGTARGQECPGIARDMGLSAKTVNKYRQIAMHRLGVRTAAQAVAVCLLRGWLPRAALRVPEVPHRTSPVKIRNTYRERAALLRETPGEWGIVAVYDSGPTARQSAYRLRTGAFKAFRPPGMWEAEAFTEDGEHRVRARYLGTTDTTEREAS